MPKIWPILAQGFTSVFERLGIQAVPSGQQWFLSDTLIPVSIVDSDVALTAIVTPSIEVIHSTGVLVAPAAGTILADTGALAAGNYQFRMLCSVRDTTNAQDFQVQHRNAGNTANLKEEEIYADPLTGATNFLYSKTLTIATNERVRILNRLIVAAGARIQASIFRTSL